jgi:hypothetical protein
MWRLLMVIVFGSAVGATLIAPVAAGVTGPGAENAASVIATTQTRSASCAGLDFYPSDRQTFYNDVGTLRVRNGTGGKGIFRCDPGLPNGAVVTKVQFTLRDDWPSTIEVKGCSLVRSGLTTTTATSSQRLASVLGTGGAAAPGIVRVTDTSIVHATIDNAKFGYWLECTINGATEDGLGIYGADVIYTISAAKG